eukprot:30676-Pelagococcus_subviridis.AAC.5
MAGRPVEREFVVVLEARENIFRLEFLVRGGWRSCARSRDGGGARRVRAGRIHWLGSSVSEA